MVTPTESVERNNTQPRVESEAEVESERRVPREDPQCSPPAPDSTDAKEDPAATPVASPAVPANKESSSRTAPMNSPPSTPPPAPPEPPRCWGVRAYDGGYYDVGSFYIFHPEAASAKAGTETEGMSKGKKSTGDAGKEPEEPVELSHPFGYRFLAGLKVVDGRNGKEIAGGSSDAAVQTFVELERQAGAVRRGVGCSLREDSSVKEREDVAKPPADSNDEDAKTNPYLVVGNTDNNETVQGFIRQGRTMWLGTFGLPPAPHGKEEEVLDIWPRRVLRISEETGSDEAVALEGAPDGQGPLVSPTDAKGDNGGGEGDGNGGVAIVREEARTSYRLMTRALAELRSFVDPPPENKEDEVDRDARQKSGQEQAQERGRAQEPEHRQNRQRVKDEPAVGPSSRGSGKEIERAGPDRGDPMAVVSANGNGVIYDDKKFKEMPESEARSRGCEFGKELERGVYGGRGGGGGMGSGRGSPGRKRPRLEAGYPPHAPSSRNDHEDHMTVDRREQPGARSKTEREAGNYRDDGDVDDGVGAGEMTVVAVRTSLLRNRADEGPSPDDGEWENMVRGFIGYVEGLPPGPKQEELSLMFAAALDPTLVRMRAANALLVRLADECAMPETDVEDEEDEEEEEGEYGTGSRGNGAGGVGGFKVRLELDATDADDPPPEGIEYLLKTVGAARGALKAAARARACMVAAGDTLGGLHELRAEYKRTLPPGPREPIQSIIAEEQARVRGYATAHEEIANHRIHELRLRGREVGEAYRAVEREPGWNGVRRQVDVFLRRFAAYCSAQLPGEGSEPGLLGLDIPLPPKMGDGWRG